MTRSILGQIRSLAFFGALALAASAPEAKAGYTLTFSNVTYSGSGISATTLDFAAPPQQSEASDNFAASFNVLNIGEPTASPAGSGTYTVQEMVTITGAAGTETGTLMSIYSISGQLANFVTYTFTPSTGAGDYVFSGPTYSQPGIGSSAVGGSGSVGNLSLVVTPTSVPEPASLAMLGLGLIGVGAYEFRRRRSAR